MSTHPTTKTGKKKDPDCYVVMTGRKNGIFLHWADACKSNEGVRGNRNHCCESIEEAETLLILDSNTNSEDLMVHTSYDVSIPVKQYLKTVNTDIFRERVGDPTHNSETSPSEFKTCSNFGLLHVLTDS